VSYLAAGENFSDFERIDGRLFDASKRCIEHNKKPFN